MSIPLQDRVAGADVLPPYVWRNPEGEAVAGGDARLVSEKIILLGIALPRPAPGFELLQLLESSEALSRFSKLDSALRSLQSEPESDEFGPMRPSATSVARVKEVLFPLVQRGVGFPETLDVGADHDGAVRVVWENGPRFLELVAPYEDDAAAYFYYSEGDQFGLQRDLTADTVRRRFNWLSGAR
jgi:hypothetical protein